MIEEALNFGMNATQLAKVSNLQSDISELDYSIQSILNNLDSMQQEQSVAIEKQEQAEQRQEREYQKQQQVLKLRESIFNFKTNMEDAYQSNKLTIENKYLQFRDACRSSAIQTLNPNYFDTFEDKEYVISVKKYFIKTRDELFDNLNNSKKSIVKSLEGKENKLKKIVNLGIEKPDLPREPLFDRGKLKNIIIPVKPNNFYMVSEERRKKDSNSTQGFTDIHIAGVFVVLVLSFILAYIIGDIFPIAFFLLPLIFIISYLVYLYNRISKPYDIRKKIYEYRDLLFRYERNEEFNKNLLKEYKDQLQYYKDYEEKAIVQNYQNALKRYEDNQGDIKTLKEEIVTLYQFLNNYIFYEN